MSLVCCKLQPRRKANNQNASTSAIIRATIGEPISCSVPSRGCEGGISVAETVPAMIIAIGITISEVTSATPGGFILSLNFVAPSSLVRPVASVQYFHRHRILVLIDYFRCKVANNPYGNRNRNTDDG